MSSAEVKAIPSAAVGTKRSSRRRGTRGLKNAGKPSQAKPSQAAGCISDSPRAPCSRSIPFLGLASRWPLTLRLRVCPARGAVGLSPAAESKRTSCAPPFVRSSRRRSATWMRTSGAFWKSSRHPDRSAACTHALARFFFGLFDLQARVLFRLGCHKRCTALTRGHCRDARTGSECVRFHIGDSLHSL